MRNFASLKIAVAGTGYVGLSIATLLAQHHQVTAADIIPEKVYILMFFLSLFLILHSCEFELIVNG